MLKYIHIYWSCKSVTPFLHRAAKQILIPGGGIIIRRSLSQGGDRDPVSDGGLWGSEPNSPLSLPASNMAVGPLDPTGRNNYLVKDFKSSIMAFFVKSENSRNTSWNANTVNTEAHGSTGLSSCW